MTTITVHYFRPNGEKGEFLYEMLKEDSRIDILKRCVMQIAHGRYDWWSEWYKKDLTKIEVKEMPHSYLWKNDNGDVYQVLKEEYDK